MEYNEDLPADELTSIVAVSGVTKEEDDGSRIYGCAVRKWHKRVSAGKHSGLIRTRSGERAALKTAVHLLSHVAPNERHFVITREKLLAGTMTPGSLLYGWDENGVVRAGSHGGVTEETAAEYQILKSAQDSGRFQCAAIQTLDIDVNSEMNAAFRSAKALRKRAQEKGLTLFLDQELWDEELEAHWSR